jgi:heat-inducible transcriptional repressor
MQLSKRAFSVLYAVVELYIRSGAPVASRLVARHSGLGLSSATIRNVMAELEDAGLLERPHTSAGSVPSDRGLRVYVDSLPAGSSPPPRIRQEIEARMDALRRELEEDIEWVAELVADATREAGMAIRPVGSGPSLEALSLVLLGGRRVLGVIVTDDGTVEKRVIEMDAEPHRERLQEVSNLLTRSLAGTRLGDVAEHLDGPLFADPTRGSEDLRADALEIARKLFTTSEIDVEVRVVGTENLLASNEFAEIERVRSLMTALSDRPRIASELRRAFARGRTQVFIGGESSTTADGGLGMVATLYFRDHRRVGAIGVVGPRRLDYQRIVPVVEFIGDTLTHILETPGASHA